MSQTAGQSDTEKGQSGSGSSSPNRREGDGVVVVDAAPQDQDVVPAQLTNLQQNIFMFFITLSQLVQMIPLGAGINSGLAIGEALGASHIQSVWIVASYPLTQAAFVLIGGRLGTVWGHKYTFAIGCAIWTVWAFCGGYAPNLVAVCLLRGLCGIGGGLMIPNIVALIGINFPPGPKRSLGFALYGAMAPVGAAGGSLISAVLVQLTEWKWLFFFLGLLGVVVYTVALSLCPSDTPIDPKGKIDWVGAALGVSGLILFNFAWNQAPATGWDEPYNIALLIVSILFFMTFSYWEIKVAKDPILPFHIWTAPSFGYLLLVIFLAFMGISIFFWYMNIYMITIRDDSLIRVGVQYLPLTIGGCAVAFFSAWLVVRVPAQVIICMGCVATIACNLFIATIPRHLTYWAMGFPAMCISAFTIDLLVTSAQIITNNSVPVKYQGVAGSLVGVMLCYGQATGLGFAGIVEVNTFGTGQSKDELLHGYHMAGFLGVGLAGIAFLISAFIIRIPKESHEGWGSADEDAAERN